MESYPRKPIRISSKSELDREMKRIHQLFKKNETDETWQSFNLALTNIKVWALEDKAHEYEGFVDHIKSLQRPIIKALTTERTRLSGTATDLLKGLSQAMQREYEAIHELFTPTLIRLFARTNKVCLTRSLDCLQTLIENAKMAKAIPRLCDVLKSRNEPSKSLRQGVAECLNKAIQINTCADLQPYLSHIEAAIKSAAMDPSPEVRVGVRTCYKTYSEKFPEQASSFEKGLAPDVKKYLNVALPSPPSSSSSSSSLKSSIKRSSLSLKRTTQTRPTSATTSTSTTTTARRHTEPQAKRIKTATATSLLKSARNSYPHLPRSRVASSSSSKPLRIARTTPSSTKQPVVSSAPVTRTTPSSTEQPVVSSAPVPSSTSDVPTQSSATTTAAPSTSTDTTSALSSSSKTITPANASTTAIRKKTPSKIPVKTISSTDNTNNADRQPYRNRTNIVSLGPRKRPAMLTGMPAMRTVRQKTDHKNENSATRINLH